MDQQTRARLGAAAKKRKALERADEVEAAARALNPNLSLIKETYQGTRFPCQWSDLGFGTFWRTPLSVLQQRAAFHPDHVQLRKQQAGVYERLAELSKQAIKTKYGVQNPSQIPGVQRKVQATKEKNGTYRTSQEEREFGDWLASLGSPVRKLQTPASDQSHYLIDFYLPEKKLAIEYNGDFWHSAGNRKMTKTYHKKRQLACQAQGIQLIQVFASEWKERRVQIQQFLTAKICPPQQRIFARKLDLRTVPTAEAKEFFTSYHIQGYASGQALGLYSGAELLSACVVGKHHRDGQQYTLRRFVTKPDVQVIGALSRLSTAAARLVKEPLISWVDLRWATTAGYEAAGWVVQDVLEPDYWYWDDRNKKRVPKQARKKDAVATPASLSEGQHARSQRLWRVYDCGKARLTFTLS